MSTDHEPQAAAPPDVPPGPPRRHRSHGRQMAWTAVIAVAVTGSVWGTGQALAGGASPSGCTGQVYSWWNSGGGKTAFDGVTARLRTLQAAAVAAGKLTSGSSAAQAAADARAIESGGTAVRGSSAAALRNLPPGCSSQLTRDLAAYYADEAGAGGDYASAGRDLTDGLAGSASAQDDLTAAARQAAASQDTANRDAALVLADMKTISGS